MSLNPLRHVFTPTFTISCNWFLGLETIGEILLKVWDEKEVSYFHW